MPIEIRELVIKAVINNKAQKPASDSPVEGSTGAGNQNLPIDEVVQQVLELISENKNER